uniref:Uncharacterized protein n=1 Tax=Globodera rostochiensis TaxID=31243 RepID=A0A914GXR2_GLORO
MDKCNESDRREKGDATDSVPRPRYELARWLFIHPNSGNGNGTTWPCSYALNYTPLQDEASVDAHASGHGQLPYFGRLLWNQLGCPLRPLRSYKHMPMPRTIPPDGPLRKRLRE